MMFAKSSLLVASAVSASKDDWEAWKQEHGKVYNGADEDAYRRSIFEQNLAEAAELQKQNPLAEFGSTQFSDLSPEEFSDFLGFSPMPDGLPEAPKLNLTVPVADAKDWTDTATTPVKNQGRCGSCWAFSAVEQLESMYMLQSGTKVELAPQELVDCKADQSQRRGCGGGDPMEAYKVIKALGGIELESDYPYQGSDQQCRFSKSKVVVTASNGRIVGSRDEGEMKNYVGSTGPLSACGYASSWSSYRGGVMTSCGTGGGHCFQIVGYGTDNGVDYWKIRNSWGSSFGEKGFIRLQRDTNLCGINGHSSTVDAAAVDTNSVVV